jgi:biopolymer transport protein ExbB/TolQ
MWWAMGLFARGVVLFLLGMSCLSLATGFERLGAFRRAAKDRERYFSEWRAVLSADATAEVRHYAYDRAVRHAVLVTGAALRRGLGTLATVGATAPFVGLVGTVLGVVDAFQEIGLGQSGLGQVSAGIAEALITTAVGIGVAIPAIWLYNYFTQRIGRILVDLESDAQRLAVATLTSPGATQ